MKQTNLTLEELEKQVQRKLLKMYKSFPNAETEIKIETALARKLGGKLAEAFFK